MFPRFVMLVAYVPLLLPPGVCACGASEAAAPKHTTAEPAKEPPKRCGCRSHAHAKSEVPLANVVTPAPHEPERPAHHAPGCPATPGADRSTLAERAPPVDQLMAVAFVAEVFTHSRISASESRSTFAGARSAARAADSPAYLKHCALLL